MLGLLQKMLCYLVVASQNTDRGCDFDPSRSPSLFLETMLRNSEQECRCRLLDFGSCSQPNTCRGGSQVVGFSPSPTSLSIEETERFCERTTRRAVTSINTAIRRHINNSIGSLSSRTTMRYANLIASINNETGSTCEGEWNRSCDADCKRRCKDLICKTSKWMHCNGRYLGSDWPNYQCQLSNCFVAASPSVDTPSEERLAREERSQTEGTVCPQLTPSQSDEYIAFLQGVFPCHKELRKCKCYFNRRN